MDRNEFILNAGDSYWASFAEPKELAHIAQDGSITWNEGVGPSEIMASPGTFTEKVALLALWHATHLLPDPPQTA